MLKVATHNVRGISTLAKATSLVGLWSRLQLDVVCVQETHVTSLQQLRVQGWLDRAAIALHHGGWEVVWGLQGHQAHGVAVLVRKALVVSRQVQVLVPVDAPAVPGRVQTVHMCWGGHSLAVINVYLPSGDSAAQRDMITQHLQPYCAQRHARRTIMMGDFNFVPQPRLDRLTVVGGQTQPQPPAHPDVLTAAAFEAACPGLPDVFRSLHPTRRCHTHVWLRPDQSCGGSRLDRIHAAAPLLPYFASCYVAHQTVGDHRPVLATLTPAVVPGHRAGQGRQRIHAGFLSDAGESAALSQLITAAGVEIVEAAPRDPNTALALWSQLKHDIAVHCRRAGRAAVARAASLSAAAQQAADSLAEAERLSAAPFPDHAALTAQALGAGRALALATARPHNAPTWLHHQECPAPHFSKLIRPPQAAAFIPVLRGQGGALVQDPMRVPDALNAHFAGICTPPPVSVAAQQEVLAAVRQYTPPISEGCALALAEAAITAGQVASALTGAAGDSSPGPDGLPMAVYKACVSAVSPVLAAVFTAMAASGTLPVGFLDGVITPVYKAGDRTAPANYRPLTMLNTDYRILARVLAAQLQPALDDVIAPEQSAFLAGRSIGENIQLMQLLPDLLPGTPLHAAAVALLDFYKAYDTLDRPFLLQLMEAMAVPAAFRAWVALLLSATYACTHVNGRTSSTQCFGAGVRQGCPLAPLLYLFVGQGLQCILRAKGVGVDVAGHRLPAMQFADDTKALLASLTEPDVQRLQTALLLFEQASGQRCNVRKCKLLPLCPPPRQPGSQRPDAVLGIPVVLQATDLGVTLSALGPSAPWPELMLRVRACYTKIASMGLSAVGRGIAASAYGISQVLYHAEFAGLPPEPELRRLKRWARHLVDRSMTPAASDAAPRRTTAVPQALLCGIPKSGGFGLLPFEDHITARHAVWAARFLSGVCDPTPPWWVMAGVRVMAAQRLLGPVPAVHFLALPGLRHNPPSQAAAFAMPDVVGCLSRCGPVISRIAHAFASLPPLVWIDDPWMGRPPGAWCHAMPLWHVPSVLVGQQRLPAHLAFPDLYAMDSKPWTLGQAVWMRAAREDFTGLSPQQVLRRLHASNSMLYLPALLASLPAEWVAAAQAHAQLLQSGEPEPEQVATVMAAMIASCRLVQELPFRPVSLHDLTVKIGTGMLQHHVHATRCAKHAAFIASALAAPAAPVDMAVGLRRTLTDVWRLPVPNTRKEILWRLALDGVAGARALHPWVPVHACGCGASGLRDMRLHHFWDCPVAQAVVAAVRSRMPGGNAAVCERKHVWLLVPPDVQRLNATVWQCVCLAALGAMDKGRRALTSAWLQWQELPVPDDVDAAAEPGVPGPREAPPALSVVWQAAARQAAEIAFHSALGFFARYLSSGQPDWLASVPEDGMFMHRTTCAHSGMTILAPAP